MDRQRELKRLIECLQQLIPLLERELDCGWTNRFRVLLIDAQSLEDHSPSQQQLSDLSSTITGAFGGMGSFSDYIPHVDGVPAPWAEELDCSRRQLYSCAVNLRAI